jgi:AraC-like DNA-binding protein
LAEQGFISTAQYFALWRAVEQLSPDPALGLSLVLQTDSGAHPPSTLCAFYAKDYRDGLSRIARFKRLCTPEQLRVVEDRDVCSITSEWLYANEVEPAISTDITFAMLVELGRRGTGQPIRPFRIELTRTRPVGDAHQRYFDCPITFGSERNQLFLNRSDLDRPFPGHNPELLAILTPALATSLRELTAQSSTAEQVKTVLKRSLASGRPELGDVARELGMSERTLQRRITDEDSSFRELLVQARRELGYQLLSDPSVTNDEVAFLLGFQDTSSFYRAFRDWEGMSPSTWRSAQYYRLAAF